MIAATHDDGRLILDSMTGDQLLEIALLRIAKERRDAEVRIASKAVMDEAETGMDYMARVTFRAIVATLGEPAWYYGEHRDLLIDAIGRQGGHPEVIPVARKVAAEIRGLR